VKRFLKGKREKEKKRKEKKRICVAMFIFSEQVVSKVSWALRVNYQ
jgi:hypothetical protein